MLRGRGPGQARGVGGVCGDPAGGRLLKTVLDRLTLVVSLGAVAYHFMTVWVIPHGATRHYAVHFGLILVLAVLATGSWALEGGRARPRLQLALLAVVLALGVFSAIYLYVEDTRLEVTQPWLTTLDFAVGAMLTLVVLGMTYMIWGVSVTLICVVCIAYFFYGHLLPGILWHVEMAPTVVMSYVAGMGAPRGTFWAIPLSAETVFLLLTYGGLLQGARVIEMFIEIGKAVGNVVRGGIAYSAVVSSSLIAMVTGEAISNVALSGAMTIPAMKARGFKSEQAGAIEVVASSGSQITPPIMSVAAFLMAVILNVAYIEIIQRAILPALLYYLGLAISISLMIRSSPNVPYERERVNLTLILGILPSFAISFLVLVALLYLRYSPGFAAFWASMALLALSPLRPEVARPSLTSVLTGFKRGAVVGAQLAVVLAAIGIIIQTFITTGVGIVLGRIITETAAGQLWLALLIGAAICIAIGTALPTPAAYALIAVVVIPALIDLGARPFSAHFFGLYWAAFSTITPPVAVAVMTAVRISGGSFLGTAWEAIKLSIPVFFLPFAYVLTPGILGIPHWGLETLEIGALIFLASLASAGALFGFLPVRLTAPERWLLAAGPLSLFGYLATRSGWLILPALVTLMAIGARRRLGAMTAEAPVAGGGDPPGRGPTRAEIPGPGVSPDPQKGRRQR